MGEIRKRGRVVLDPLLTTRDGALRKAPVRV